MSSDGSETTRCMFCSLNCPLGLKSETRERFSPDYAPRDGVYEGRQCFRGHYVSQLLAHPERLNRPMIRSNGDLKAADWETSFSHLAQRLGDASAGGLSVLIDAQMPNEHIEACLRIAQSAMGTDLVGVYLPAPDEGLLEGLADFQDVKADPDTLARVDTVLAVGDPFATHPVIAKRILDTKAARRSNRLIVIDCMTGKTLRFADQQLLVAPGVEARVLDAIRSALDGGQTDDLVHGTGLTTGDVARAANGFREAERPLIILSAPEGRSPDARQLARSAGELARVAGARILALFAYGNAPGAWRMARREGALTCGQWLAGTRTRGVAATLLVGIDLARAVPERVWSPVLAEGGVVAAAAALPGRTFKRAEVVFPMSLWCEMDGALDSYALSGLKQTGAACVPSGARDPSEILAGLAEPLPQSGETAVADEQLSDEAPEPEGDLTLVSYLGHLDFADGALTRRLDWVQAMEPRARLFINPTDAERLGVCDGDMAHVAAVESAAELAAHVSDDVPAGVVAAPMGFPEVRELMSWNVRADSTVDVGPSRVSVVGVRGNG